MASTLVIRHQIRRLRHLALRFRPRPRRTGASKAPLRKRCFAPWTTRRPSWWPWSTRPETPLSASSETRCSRPPCKVLGWSASPSPCWANRFAPQSVPPVEERGRAVVHASLRRVGVPQGEQVGERGCGGLARIFSSFLPRLNRRRGPSADPHVYSQTKGGQS